mmetsp:Transcript_62129/g.173547  ORF Transcript_62129/g.173547 Transcript_62129/m.173547 type:complete len:389 (+) Transcript_62129:159-1325(+)
MLGDGRRAAGELRPPRHAHGHGPRRIRIVGARAEVRPPGSELDGPRPVRPLHGPRLDAPLRPHPPRGRARHRARWGALPWRRRRRPRRRPRRAPASHKGVPAARLLLPGAPGVPLHRWRRDDDGAFGAGRGQQRGHGDGVEVVRADVQQARLRALQLRRLRDVRRWLHAGGPLLGGRVVGRPPQARQPLLDLGQQPNHHRGQHLLVHLRGHPHTVPRLRLERAARGRRERRRGLAPGHQRLQAREAAPNAHRRRFPHRLGGADEAGPLPRPRLAAWRGGGRGDEGDLRLAQREVPGTTGGARPLPRSARPPQRRQAEGLAGDVGALWQGVSERGGPAAAHHEGDSAGRMGRGMQGVPSGPEGLGHAAVFGEGAEHGRQGHPLVAGRLR